MIVSHQVLKKCDEGSGKNISNKSKDLSLSPSLSVTRTVSLYLS